VGRPGRIAFLMSGLLECSDSLTVFVVWLFHSRVASLFGLGENLGERHSNRSCRGRTAFEPQVSLVKDNALIQFFQVSV
jgi:hypothetical protein